MSSEKTEQPTEHKIREARKDGQVAKSKDFTQALLMGILLAYFLGSTEFFIREMVEMIIFPTHLYGMEFQAAAKLLIDALLMGLVIILIPYLLIVIGIGIFAEIIQTGPLLAFKALIPKGDKLNPVSNLKQMFSMKNIMEFVKSILKVIFLTILIYIVIRDSIAPLLFLPSKSIATAGVALGSMLKDMAIYSFIGFFAIALADLIFQRYQHIKQLMMSMDEIKQEFKQLEGDPHMKSHRKGIAKEIAMGEMVQKTRKASLLLTNPTHLAIALYYEQDKTPLPIVIAKGADETAFAMINTARFYGIPVMQNIMLARALMHDALIDQYIPSSLIEPVAEMLIALRKLTEGEWEEA
jgi:type III secretion protein U